MRVGSSTPPIPLMQTGGQHKYDSVDSVGSGKWRPKGCFDGILVRTSSVFKMDGDCFVNNSRSRFFFYTIDYFFSGVESQKTRWTLLLL